MNSNKTHETLPRTQRVAEDPRKDPEYVFPQWRGYTLEQLHYRMSLNMARREIDAFRLRNYAEMYKRDQLQLATSSNSIVRRMMASLNLIDYAAIAIGVARKAYAIYRHLKK